MAGSLGYRGRIALAGVALVVLLLGGCGRKGMLELPPAANSAAAPGAAAPPSSQRQASGSGTGLGEPEHSALDGERTPDPAAAGTPAKKTFFLDWLLK